MEENIPVASLEEIRAVFGNRDMHARAIRRRFGVQLVSRDGQIKIFGDPDGVRRAHEVVQDVIERVRRGDTITSESLDQLLHGQETPRAGADDSGFQLPRTVQPKSEHQIGGWRHIGKLRGVTVGLYLFNLGAEDLVAEERRFAEAIYANVLGAAAPAAP